MARGAAEEHRRRSKSARPIAKTKTKREAAKVRPVCSAAPAIPPDDDVIMEGSSVPQRGQDAGELRYPILRSKY